MKLANITIFENEKDNDKDYMKIKFESNDNLPTNNIPNMHKVIIIIRSI